MKPKASKSADNKFLVGQDVKYITTSKTYNRDTAFKFMSAVFFVLITELCLGLHIHRYMAREENEIRDNFALKMEMEDYFLTLINSNAVKDELAMAVLKKIGKEVVLTRPKRHNVSHLSRYLMSN